MRPTAPLPSTHDRSLVGGAPRGAAARVLATAGCAALFGVLVAPALAPAVSEWKPEPTWSPSSAANLRARAVAVLGQIEVPDETRRELLARWRQLDDAAAADLQLELVVATAAACHPEAAALVEACRGPLRQAGLPETAWLQDVALPKLLTNNLRLFAARWFTQEGLFDEAIYLVAGLNPADVVDPATLLFIKSVCHHQLVEVKPATASAGQLLERTGEIPTRYEHLARLIAADIDAVEEDSLDHIARRMNDIRRRLAKGRATNKVVEIEDGVIESLDKLIEKLEEQRRQQQAQQQPGGGQAPTQPMQDSMLPEMKAPGNVDRKDIGETSDWGALDDKAREEALQEIGREFPSHYRDVIEQYFKRIAAEEEAER